TGADVTDATNVAAAGAFMAAGTALTSANDLNSLGATFRSVDWVTSIPANAPSGWSNGFVIQAAGPTSAGGSAQIGFQRPGGAVAVRVKHSSAWEGWNELATKAYADTKQNADANLTTLSSGTTTLGTTGLSLLGDETAADARSTLGLGTAATLNSGDASGNQKALNRSEEHSSELQSR